MSNIRTEAVKQYDYDVAVIGSGSGGIAAAVAAARNGCRVLVLEKNGYVGGMTTARASISRLSRREKASHRRRVGDRVCRAAEAG